MLLKGQLPQQAESPSSSPVGDRTWTVTGTSTGFVHASGEVSEHVLVDSASGHKQTLTQALLVYT